MRLRTLPAVLMLWMAGGGCGNWHALRPTTANNVQVGSLTMYVVSADFGLRRDVIRMVVVIDNPSSEPQQWDPQWVSFRGSSGLTFPPTHIQPPLPASLPPGQRLQTTYMFHHVPDHEVSQMTLLVAGTETMRFTGVY